MTDTYEFLKAQKDAILAKKEADENEWLKAAAEDIAHYKQERDLALAECERLRADAERWQHLVSQHEINDDEATNNNYGKNYPRRTLCVFCDDGEDGLEPIPCDPGALNAAIDAARAKP